MVPNACIRRNWGSLSLIPLAIPNLRGNEGAYLQERIDSNYVSSVDPFVDRMESMVSESTGSRSTVVTSSGTTSLHLALTSVRVGSGDLVILPTFTFIASANAISHCGASPWFLGVQESSWTPDPDDLAAQMASQCRWIDGKVVLTPAGRRVTAIMPAPMTTINSPAPTLPPWHDTLQRVRVI